MRNSKLPPKSFYPSTTESIAVPPVPQEYAPNLSAGPSTTGVLTPELIATLATLLPTNKQSSSSESNQPALGSSIVRPQFSSVAPDRGISSQGWKHDNQVSGNASHLQMGNQFNSQVQVQSQFQPYPSVPNTYSHSATVVPSNSQVQDSTASLSHQSVTSSRPLTNFSMPSQSGQFALSPQPPSIIQKPNHTDTLFSGSGNELFSDPIWDPTICRQRELGAPQSSAAIPTCSFWIWAGHLRGRGLTRISAISQLCSLQPTSCSRYSSSSSRRLLPTQLHTDLEISNEFALIKKGSDMEDSLLKMIAGIICCSLAPGELTMLQQCFFQDCYFQGTVEHKCNSLGAAKILLGFWTCFTRTQFHQLSLEIFLRSTQLASSHSSSLGISKYPVLPLSLVRVREECKERQNLNIFGCKQLLRTVTALCLFRKAIRALQIL
ncbi:hypothetical protein NC653_037906 [Populus alba x Populus x berolinensis]|uniref:Uncharacterized protein n=1 Tax=Populus alba x Populus x berolinensis TaxID=444605 RepID=A0AAD6LFB4_9ROSI|nr:hypothetical protein NC653_037906 [Populus alba x Populus x berolinensis]